MDFRAIAQALALHPDRLTVTRLTGGVSSDIYLLDDGHTRLVAKQSIAQLRVAAHWPADRQRIWREIDALKMLAPICAVPQVVYEDRAAYLYVMTAAPADAETWKAHLLRGDADPAIARRIGQIQAAFLERRGVEEPGIETPGLAQRRFENHDIEKRSIENCSIEQRSIEQRSIEERGIDQRGIESHDIEKRSIENCNIDQRSFDQRSFEQRSIEQRGFDDLRFFEELRIDPYYTFTAARYPDLAWAFARATQACRENRWGLVHGDWSPKNIMVGRDGQPLALDFECVHYGDPAYDAAFLLNHLLLKTFYRPASADAYLACAEAFLAPLHRIAFAQIMIHLPVLLLARLDGKSPADYIRDPAPVRALARWMLSRPPASPAEIWLRLKG